MAQLRLNSWLSTYLKTKALLSHLIIASLGRKRQQNKTTITIPDHFLKTIFVLISTQQ